MKAYACRSFTHIPNKCFFLTVNNKNNTQIKPSIRVDCGRFGLVFPNYHYWINTLCVKFYIAHRQKPHSKGNSASSTRILIIEIYEAYRSVRITWRFCVHFHCAHCELNIFTKTNLKRQIERTEVRHPQSARHSTLTLWKQNE